MIGGSVTDVTLEKLNTLLGRQNRGSYFDSVTSVTVYLGWADPPGNPGKNTMIGVV